MNRLQRLYVREFALLLIVVSVMLSGLFAVLSIAEQFDELLPGIRSPGTITLLLILRIPEYLRYLLPVAALMSSIFVVSLASRRNEIVAVKASGVNLRTFFLPFLVVGGLLVCGDFVVAELLNPASMKKTHEMIYSSEEGKGLSRQGDNIWFRGRKGVIVRAGLFIPQKTELHGVSIFYISEGRLIRRIEAERGVWSGRDWRLLQVREFDLERERVLRFPEKRVKGIGEPDVLERERRRLLQMSVFELMDYAERLKEAGYGTRKITVDIHSRLSYPLTNLFMVVAGIFLSLKSRRGRGLVSAGAGILISLAYWFIYTFSLSLGYAGVIPPVAAAWGVPLVFLAAGGYLYARMPS